MILQVRHNEIEVRLIVDDPEEVRYPVEYLHCRKALLEERVIIGFRAHALLAPAFRLASILARYSFAFASSPLSLASFSNPMRFEHSLQNPA